MSREGECYAIWLGQFRSIMEADDFLHLEFCSAFEAFPEEANVPELSVTEPTSVRSILAPFSCSSLFLDTAVALANAEGIGDVTTAIVFYHTRFDERELMQVHDSRVYFLGNVKSARHGNR